MMLDADPASAEALQDGAARQPKKAGARRSTKAMAAELEKNLGYTFKDADLFAVALTHVSALKSARNRTESYQRLEFLGDHVLGLVVSDMLYRAFPNADEGEMSKRLADLVRRETCADVAKNLGMLEAIKLGTVGHGAGARLRKSVLGDICEAVIGAIFLDGGYAAAADFVRRNWTDRMQKPMKALRDPKTVLQEWAQGRGLPPPTYQEIARTGPDHDPVFSVAVELPGHVPAEGRGSSKRAAEKAAATALLVREGVLSGTND